MGVGGRAERGLGPPCILKTLAKKGCFLSFEWEKDKFTTFGHPEKNLEKNPSAAPGKNPSDAHDCSLGLINRAYRS